MGPDMAVVIAKHLLMEALVLCAPMLVAAVPPPHAPLAHSVIDGAQLAVPGRSASLREVFEFLAAS